MTWSGSKEAFRCSARQTQIGFPDSRECYFLKTSVNAYMQNLATGCLSRRQTLCCSLYNTYLTQSVVKLGNPSNPPLSCNVVTSKREKSCNERHLKPNALLLHSSGKLAKNVMIHVYLFSFDAPQNDLRACPYFVTQGSKTFKHSSSSSSRLPPSAMYWVDLGWQLTLFPSYHSLLGVFARKKKQAKLPFTSFSYSGRIPLYPDFWFSPTQFRTQRGLHYFPAEGETLCKGRGHYANQKGMRETKSKPLLKIHHSTSFLPKINLAHSFYSLSMERNTTCIQESKYWSSDGKRHAIQIIISHEQIHDDHSIKYFQYFQVVILISSLIGMTRKRNTHCL